MQKNDHNFLDEKALRELLKEGKWVRQNSALLVFHGVGSQRTLETLDAFARGLVETYAEYGGVPKSRITLSHRLAKKPDGKGGVWFDNFIRIEREGSKFHLDLYEYYWAHYSEHKVTLDAMQAWVKYTYKGAKNFYAQQALGEQYGDRSLFFDTQGSFRPMRYRISLMAAMQLIPALTRLTETLLGLLRKIPVAGSLLVPTAERLRDTLFYQICNVAGDVVVYNTNDPKEELYSLRKKILGGAVDALRYLVEPLRSEKGDSTLRYERVIVAGHSLGSQIAFDAVNRLTHLILQEELDGVSKDGTIALGKKKRNIAEVFSGFVTFGCPLDKIAFFLRERAKEEAYLRAQMLVHFHAFKQKEWPTADRQKPHGVSPFLLQNTLLPRLFDAIPWDNYHDGQDPVSGYLDFYNDVRNVDCRFIPDANVKIPALWPFTHSRYWTHKPMYADIFVRHLFA